MTSARRRVASTAALSVLALVVYLPVVGSSFVGDDFEGILEVVRRGSFGSFEHTGGNFRPVAWLTLAIDHGLWGNDPVGFHLFNIVAHAINGALVALVAAMLIDRLRPTTPSRLRGVAAGIAGALFVVLPSHTEAVSWIAGRGDVVMTAGCLVALAAWLRSGSARTAWWRLASSVALALALLSKESAVVVPVVVSMLEIAAHTGTASPTRSVRSRAAAALRSSAAAWPLYATVVGFLIVRRVVRGNFVDGYGGQYEQEGPVRLVGKAALAVARSVVPGMPVLAWVVVLVVGAVAFGAAVVVAHRSATGDAGDGLLVWFLVGAVLVCVVPMAPAGVSAFDTGGERLVYLPSVFGVIGVAWVLARLVDSRRRLGIAAVGAVGVAAVASLLVVNAVWVEAGETAEHLVADSGRWREGDRVVVLNSPDSLRGAYVFRNAMAGSMALIHGWRSPVVVEVAGVLVTSPTDDVEVAPGSCDRCLTIRLLEPDSSFVRVATAGSEFAVDGVVATQVDDHTLEVRFDRPSSGPDYDVWYLDGGRLVRAELDG